MILVTDEFVFYQQNNKNKMKIYQSTLVTFKFDSLLKQFNGIT